MFIGWAAGDRMNNPCLNCDETGICGCLFAVSFGCHFTDKNQCIVFVLIEWIFFRTIFYLIRLGWIIFRLILMFIWLQHINCKVQHFPHLSNLKTSLFSVFFLFFFLLCFRRRLFSVLLFLLCRRFYMNMFFFAVIECVYNICIEFMLKNICFIKCLHIFDLTFHSIKSAQKIMFLNSIGRSNCNQQLYVRHSWFFQTKKKTTKTQLWNIEY